MTTIELKYLGQWLRPLREGYSVEYPIAADYSPSPGGGGSLIGQPRTKTPFVTASFLLRDRAMMAWFSVLWRDEITRGPVRILVPLLVFGVMQSCECVITGKPQYGNYQGRFATVQLRLAVTVSELDTDSAAFYSAFGADWLVDLSDFDDLINSELPDNLEEI